MRYFIVKIIRKKIIFFSIFVLLNYYFLYLGQQIVKVTTEDGQESIQYLSGAAANSLIQLSQMGSTVEANKQSEETILVPQDSVVEISGDSGARYVVIDGENGTTKLVEYTEIVQEEMKLEN